MVKLGFIKDAGQAPPGFHRVFLRPWSSREPYMELKTEVRSWPNKSGAQFFELAVDVPVGAEHVPGWAGPLAGVICNMGWSQWWIDSFSLSMVLDRYITEALKIWGLEFWKNYTLDGVVLVQVGLQREAVFNSVKIWSEHYKDVRFSNVHDYDAIEREYAQQHKTRTQRLKELVKQKFLSAKRES